MGRVTRLAVACGGTGGHLYPGIAVVGAFRASGSDIEVLFVGTAGGMEARLIPEKGFQFAAVSASGFVGKGTGARLTALWRVSRGFFEARRLLRRFSPHLVIGVGGYVSVPVILASVFLRIPRVILEPNARPGLANRLLAPFCSLIVVAFEGSRRYLRSRGVRVLGIPVRSEILAVRREAKGHLTLLVLGGSQGAQAINRTLVAALPLLEPLKERLMIIHQTGNKDFEWVQSAYRAAAPRARVQPFIDDMASVYAQADLVVGRSGAGTLGELTALGLPSILIPFPHAAGHQEDNAREVERAGGARVLLQSELSPEKLAGAVMELLSDPERLSRMGEAAGRLGKPRAAEEIVEACKGLLEP